jgi:hypothetical protein
MGDGMKRGRPAKVAETPKPPEKVYSQEFIDGFNHGVSECRRTLTARLPYFQTDWHVGIMNFVRLFDEMKDKP